MRLIGLAVVHTVGLVLAPLAAEAQQTGKVPDWSHRVRDAAAPGRPRVLVVSPTWLPS
jgi:hypothetical protein